ncbi:MAG: hypothetical protein KDC98_05385 [Planctomycetes bacterium]|nr:hypothetical protein [Planctomycetota bacterium]
MAVPHPEEALQQVERLARRGLPAVTLVMGSNDYFRGEAVDVLLRAVPEDAELRVLDAVDIRAAGRRGDTDPDEDDDGAEVAGDADVAGVAACPELGELRGGGLFARTAFLVVRRAKNWWGRHAETLADQVGKFGKGCGVIVEAPKLDKRKRAVASFVKRCAEAGAVFDFRDLYELPYDRARGPLHGELAQWVGSRAKKLGVALSPEAAWMIVAQVGKQPSELVAELGRLRDQLGSDPKRKPLRPSELHGRLSIGFESTPFEFAEAVLAGDQRGALRSVRAMFARGVRGRDGRAMDSGGLFPFVTSWLHQCLARTYEGRSLLDSGVAMRDLPARAGVRGFADRFLAEVRHNELDRLRHGLLALHHCQRMSRFQGEDPEVLLERFLAHWFERRPVPLAKDFEL